MADNLNKKTVKFDLSKNKIKVLHVYSFALKLSRNGSCYTNQYYDQLRFRRRIDSLEKVLCKVLNPIHREEIYCKRFSEK